jgi:hypothetical protein
MGCGFGFDPFWNRVTFDCVGLEVNVVRLAFRLHLFHTLPAPKYINLVISLISFARLSLHHRTSTPSALRNRSGKIVNE